MNTIWFDLDGTIIRVDERFYQVHLAICKELGIVNLSREDYWQARCNGVSTQNILNRLNASNLFEKYISMRNNILESLPFLKYDKHREGIEETLIDISHSYKVNLLTARSNKENLLVQLENLQIKQFFSNIYVVSPFSKWEEKFETLNKNSNIGDFMIGDTANDIIAGKKANIKTVGILDGMSSITSLTSLNPDFIIKEFSEINKIIQDLK